jgi:hypothetical protein
VADAGLSLPESAEALKDAMRHFQVRPVGVSIVPKIEDVLLYGNGAKTDIRQSLRK